MLLLLIYVFGKQMYKYILVVYQGMDAFGHRVKNTYV